MISSYKIQLYNVTLYGITNTFEDFVMVISACLVAIRIKPVP